MSTNRKAIAKLLRWYPQAWRERYGDEVVALMEDELGGRRVTPKLKLSIFCGGLRERFHHGGLIGDQSSPPDRVRAGSLLVLCSWAAFVLAGASYSKEAEHFAQAVPIRSRAVPQGAFNLVASLGAIGAILVALGAVVTIPAFLRFLLGGGWPSVRGHLLRAIGATFVAIAGVVLLSLWAHHLNQVQRNGGDGVYGGVFALWAVVVATTLALWTAVAVAAARRIELRTQVIRFEASLAMALGGVMVAVTAATAVWWATMAVDAPWFLQGAPTRTTPSPFTLQLVLTLALMVGAVIVAGCGVLRIGRSWKRLGIERA